MSDTSQQARSEAQARQFRRLVAVGLVVFVLIVAFAYGYSRQKDNDSAQSQSTQSQSTQSQSSDDAGLAVSAPVDVNGSIPQPNSGVAPENSTDRGGWQQLTLLGVIVAAIGLMGFRVVREGQRNLARQRERATGNPGT